MYTPGPWNVAGEGLSEPVVQNGDTEICVCGPGWDACYAKEAFHNACLIAAAPDLLEACKRVAQWMDANGYDKSDQSFGVRAAIAKTEH